MYFYKSHLGFVSAFSLYFSLISELSLVGHLIPYLMEKKLRQKFLGGSRARSRSSQEDKHLA
jgi:hypothetical protein